MSQQSRVSAAGGERCRMADRPHYSFENSTIAGTLELSKGVIRECSEALAALALMERREAENDGCECLHHGDRPAGTTEDAVVIPSDDEEVENLVITYRHITRPTFVNNQPPIDDAWNEVIDGTRLTADDILCDHQKNHKLGIFVNDVDDTAGAPMDGESSTSMYVDEDVALSSLKAQMKEARSVLRKLKTNKPLHVTVPPKVGYSEKSATPGKRGRDKERNVDDDEGEDDLKEHMFGSSRYLKARDVKYVQIDQQDEPDYEVHVDSNSDRDPSSEIEDPLDYVSKEAAVMGRQNKRQEYDEKGQEGCEHTFEITNDVGTACSPCGLIKEDIKDMFKWSAPKTIRQQSQARVGRVHPWDEDGDGVLEEEARLVGKPPLEAHNSLEHAMHPHQLEGFKFLSKNLVEDDSGGCMLAFAPGTGKSFLIISFIHSFMLQVPNARPMIVAPKSMLRPWTQEFKKWQVEETMVLNLYEAGDDAAKVEMLKLWQETRSVLLVGYAQCINMVGEIGRYLIEGPGLMVLDEGHLARTENTKILKSLNRVHTKRRVLLSGTPFNNNFQEFYTTLELVRPDFMRRASAEMEATLNTLMPSEPKADSGTVSPVLKRSSNAGRQAFKDAIGENRHWGECLIIRMRLGRMSYYFST